MSVATLNFFNKGLSLCDLPYHLTWHIMFSHLMINPKFDQINNKLKDLVQKNKHLKIYPLPSYVMNAFMVTSASNLKVVFIGQDPYFNCEAYGSKYVPQAMGLSFSVPHDINIPSQKMGYYYEQG